MTLSSVEKAKNFKRWDVRLTFQYPAWDETDGIWYRGVDARTKSDANAMARREAERDGHVCSGKGRISFKAFASDDN